MAITFKVRWWMWSRSHAKHGLLHPPRHRETSADWIRFQNADISVRIARRITRTVVLGGEGDDLHDEGAESAIYTVRGLMTIDLYKQVIEMSAFWKRIQSALVFAVANPTFTTPSRSVT